MMTSSRQYWVMLLVVLQAALTISMTEVYEPEPKTIQWGYYSTLGDEVTMQCNDTNLDPTNFQTNGSQHLQWFHEVRTPMIKLTDNETSPDKYEFTEGDGLQNMYMTIKNIQTSDAGIYRCVLYHDDDVVMNIRKSLNLAGHLYDNPFDKYRENLKIGGISAAIFLVFALFTGGVYKYRYKDESRAAYNVYNGTRLPPDIAYDNPAISLDDDIPYKSDSATEVRNRHDAANSVESTSDTKF